MDRISSVITQCGRPRRGKMRTHVRIFSAIGIILALIAGLISTIAYAHGEGHGSVQEKKALKYCKDYQGNGICFVIHNLLYKDDFDSRINRNDFSITICTQPNEYHGRLIYWDTSSPIIFSNIFPPELQDFYRNDKEVYSEEELQQLCIQRITKKKDYRHILYQTKSKDN